jgi:hypothetical protein
MSMVRVILPSRLPRFAEMARRVLRIISAAMQAIRVFKEVS